MSTKKPIGRYEIDWSHPLTKGLVFAQVGSNSLNLANNMLPDINTSTPSKDGFLFDTDGDLLNYGDVDKTDGLDYCTALSSFTATSTADAGIFSKRANTGSYTWSMGLNGGVFITRLLILGSTKTLSGATTLLVNNRYSTGFIKNNNALDVYLNGVTDALQKTDVTGVTTVTTSEVVIGYEYNSSLTFRGDIHWNYFWNIALSGEQVASLDKDPYQFLKPVRTVSVPPAALMQDYAIDTNQPDTILLSQGLVSVDKTDNTVSSGIQNNPVFKSIPRKIRLVSDGNTDIGFVGTRLTGSLIRGDATCPIIAVMTSTTKGTLAVNQDGSFTYDYADDNKPDTDFFIYTITDINGTSNFARVDITIPVDGGGTFQVSWIKNTTLIGGY